MRHMQRGARKTLALQALASSLGNKARVFAAFAFVVSLLTVGVLMCLGGLRSAFKADSDHLDGVVRRVLLGILGDTSSESGIRNMWAEHVVLDQDNRISISATFESRLNGDLAPLMEKHEQLIWNGTVSSDRCPANEHQFVAFSIAKSARVPAVISFGRPCDPGSATDKCVVIKQVPDIRDIQITIPKRSNRFAFHVKIAEERSSPDDGAFIPMPRRIEPWGRLSGSVKVDLSDSAKLALQRYCGHDRLAFAEDLDIEPIEAGNIRLLTVVDLKKLYSLWTDPTGKTLTSNTSKTWKALALSTAIIDPRDHSRHAGALYELQKLLQPAENLHHAENTALDALLSSHSQEGARKMSAVGASNIDPDVSALHGEEDGVQTPSRNTLGRYNSGANRVADSELDASVGAVQPLNENLMPSPVNRATTESNNNSIWENDFQASEPRAEAQADSGRGAASLYRAGKMHISTRDPYDEVHSTTKSPMSNGISSLPETSRDDGHFMKATPDGFQGRSGYGRHSSGMSRGLDRPKQDPGLLPLDPQPGFDHRGPLRPRQPQNMPVPPDNQALQNVRQPPPPDKYELRPSSRQQETVRLMAPPASVRSLQRRKRPTPRVQNTDAPPRAPRYMQRPAKYTKMGLKTPVPQRLPRHPTSALAASTRNIAQSFLQSDAMPKQTAPFSDRAPPNMQKAQSAALKSPLYEASKVWKLPKGTMSGSQGHRY